jgi:PAS domain S-box-containing protein
MLDVFKTVVGTIKDIPWGQIKDFLRLLYSRQPVALLLAVGLLAVSVTLTTIYWRRSGEYEHIVRSTLEDQSVPTPQTYKGIDAFIMSNVPRGLDEALKKEALSTRFTPKVTSLLERFTAFASGQRPEALALRLIQDQQHRRVITNTTNTNGFLFLPVQILRTPTLLPVLQEANLDNDAIRAALGGDPELLRDVELAEFIAPQLKSFLGTSLSQGLGEGAGFSPASPHRYLQMTPRQVYFITKNGVLRIINSNEQPSVYEFQFPASTFFPSRPYFWPAFEEKRFTTKLPEEIPKLVGDYFYVSRPYMDLGGNGIVMTLVRGIQVAGLPQSAICLDLSFHQERSLSNTLTDRVQRLEGQTLTVTCKVPPTGTVDCANDDVLRSGAHNGVKSDLTIAMERFFQGKIESDQRSDVFGSIQRLNSPMSDSMHISVPIEETAAGETQVGRFLLFSLDLSAYRRRTSFLAFAASTTFGMMTVLLAYLWASLARRQREFEDAFSRVANVMCFAPTPYARLDSQDRIRDMNPAFVELLGFTPDELKRVKFEDLCSERSKEKYAKVQQKRQAGKPVEPYTLHLNTKSSGQIEVSVVSAAIPGDTLDSLPQTFGILLRDAIPLGGTLPFVVGRPRAQ